MLLTVLLTLSITLMYSAPLIFAAMGGVITQRAGVDNIGIEGMMAFGAFAGTTIGYFTGNPWIGLLASGLAGVLLALIHGLVSITLKGNQTISGIAINFIGLALGIFLTRQIFDGASQTNSVTRKIPKLFDVLGLDKRDSAALQSGDIDFTVILALLVVFLLWFILYKTTLGLRIRACGDHPAAADTLGVNVTHLRYACVMASGFLAGVGGGAMTLAVISNFTPTVISGQGFIALAAVIFGNWKPIGAALACLLFGFAQALTVLLSNSFLPSSILAMIPYALTLIVLVLFVGRAEPPRAVGQPYFKGQA